MKYYLMATFALFMGVISLSGCEQSAAEKIAIQHSEEQSRINSANYERNKLLRETKEDADHDAKNDAP